VRRDRRNVDDVPLGALVPGQSAGELADALVAASRGVKTAVPAPEPEAFRRELERMVRWLVAGASAARPPKTPRRGRR
jgi:hypothetical protein